MGFVFGFRDGEMVTPEEEGVEVDESFSVEPGQTVTDADGNVYTANSKTDQS
ncbi:hypothetical protein ABGB09_01610 [Streptomyces sp. B8F3]|uniref:hypothetical protein n=1 Tax=Streptomyces sp. B8F3 TaxID=3153573 RepID=UPI00325D048E